MTSYNLLGFWWDILGLFEFFHFHFLTLVNIEQAYYKKNQDCFTLDITHDLFIAFLQPLTVVLYSFQDNDFGKAAGRG